VKWIGLGPKNDVVRGSLSKEFRDYLTTLDKWFEYLEDFRHALAHRIPLYIPPYVVPESDEAKYQDFESRKAAAYERKDFAQYDYLSAKQDQSGMLRPWILHSFSETDAPALFHFQMLADFNTIIELGERTLRDLDGSKPLG